jgi:hypothetical protein
MARSTPVPTIEIAKGKRVLVVNEPDLAAWEAKGWTPVRVEAEAAGAEVVKADLTGLTKAELVDLAIEAGITVPSIATKADIIKLLGAD